MWFMLIISFTIVAYVLSLHERVMLIFNKYEFILI